MWMDGLESVFAARWWWEAFLWEWSGFGSGVVRMRICKARRRKGMWRRLTLVVFLGCFLSARNMR